MDPTATSSSYRDIQRRMRPHLVWCNDRIVAPKIDWSRHLPPHCGVWGIRSGLVTITCAGKSWDIGPGEWAIFLPRRQNWRFRPGTRLWSIAYRSGEDGVDEWYEAPAVLPLGRQPALEAATATLLATAQSELGPAESGSLHPGIRACGLPQWCRVNAMFLSWLSVTVDLMLAHGVRPFHVPGRDRRVERALSTLVCHPWSPDSAPSVLAKQAGLSRRRLEQLITAALGVGPAEVRSRARLNAAARLLRHDGGQIKEVAARLGFRTAAAFSVWFRRHAGQSPSTYLKHGLTGI